jgi:hypothetical protein
LQQGVDESLAQADQQGEWQPFVADQLEANHDALRSEIGSEKSSEIGSEIAAVPELARPASWRSFPGPTRLPVFSCCR